MLKRLRIKNFKLLRDVEIEFSPEVPTVLIGTNSSGKSTVLEVIDFVSHCALAGLAAALIAHGGINAIKTIGVEGAVEIESVWTLGPRIEIETSWRLRFSAPPHGEAAIDEEEVSVAGKHLVTTNPTGERSVLDEREGTATVARDRRKLAFEAFVDPERYQQLGFLRLLVANAHVIGSLSVAPAWARSSAPRQSARDPMTVSTTPLIGAEGTGLAIALYNLQVNHGDAWRTLERNLRSEFPFVKRLVFPPDPAGGRIAFAFEDERFRGRPVFSSEMSDGMIAFLCLLSILLYPDPMAVVALDEPDSNLHPSAVRRLMALAHEPHESRNLIIATHSNAVLDELEDPAESIRIVESSPTGARIRKLDAEALAAWRKDYTMSEMRQTGLLDPSNGSYGSDQ